MCVCASVSVCQCVSVSVRLVSASVAMFVCEGVCESTKLNFVNQEEGSGYTGRRNPAVILSYLKSRDAGMLGR